MDKYFLDISKDSIGKFDEAILNNLDELYSKFRFVNGVNIWNVFTTAQDRIRELSDYLRTERMALVLGERVSSYVFSEWIIYLNQLFDYVNAFSVFTGNDYKKDYDGNVFIEPRKYGESVVTDINYLEYIRSLSAIHPLNTDKHIKKGFQTEAESCLYVSGMTSTVYSMLQNDDSLIKRKPDNNTYSHEECFYLRVCPLIFKEAEKSEEFVFDYYKEMIDNNLIDNSELEAAIEQESVGLDYYILIHPKELIELGNQISKYILYLADEISDKISKG